STQHHLTPRRLPTVDTECGALLAYIVLHHLQPGDKASGHNRRQQARQGEDAGEKRKPETTVTSEKCTSKKPPNNSWHADTDIQGRANDLAESARRLQFCVCNCQGEADQCREKSRQADNDAGAGQHRCDSAGAPKVPWSFEQIVRVQTGSATIQEIATHPDYQGRYEEGSNDAR